jgi:hypothetical protein
MDALTRRAELADHALQYGWMVEPGELEFRAAYTAEGKSPRRHTIQAALSAAGAVSAARIDGQPVAGPNRLTQVIAAIRRGTPSYRPGRVSDKAGAVHWVPRQQRSGVPPQALCGVRVIGNGDYPGRWRWSHDPVDCQRCARHWDGAIAVLRNWNRTAPSSESPHLLRVYAGAATGRSPT